MQNRNVALALKYRPRRFEDLIGQNTISQTLSMALDTKRLGHAYLFSGLRGSGKTSTARIFAKSLICEKGESSDSCEICENCKSANSYKHIDIIEMDAASNRKIDDIRDMIEQTKYKPSVARYKIFIIDEVHMLTREAFNALLKTLEEPPPYVKFILATTDPLKLPATILSRTQHFSFKKISPPDIAHHLENILNIEKIEYEKEALEILARSGGGSLRDTLTLLDQVIIFSKSSIDVDSVVKMLGLLDPSKIEHMFDVIMKQDIKSLNTIAKEFESYDAEVLIEEIIEYLKSRFYEPSGVMTPFLIERFFRIMAQTKSLLAMNADNGFAIALMMFKMAEALKSEDIDEQIAKISKKVNEAHEESYETGDSAYEEIKTNDEPPKIDRHAPEDLNAHDETAEKFRLLIEKIYDRDPLLGGCFEKSVSLINFKEDTLEWMSCADEECKKQLRTYWSVIRHFVQEVFGLNVKIKAVSCDKEISEQEESLKKNDLPAEANTDSSSMIEDIELHDHADASTPAKEKENSKEYDGTEILNEPFIKKAVELFDAQKIKIKPKI